jgi:hypothetical protein
VGTALTKTDYYHIIGSFIGPQDLPGAQESVITGSDMVQRTLVQVPYTTVEGTAGRLEWIVEQDGTISHQWFVAGGSMNGLPNVP